MKAKSVFLSDSNIVRMYLNENGVYVYDVCVCVVMEEDIIPTTRHTKSKHASEVVEFFSSFHEMIEKSKNACPKVATHTH
jgi:hypothetical protein